MAESYRNWHGWPPQYWDGKRWVYLTELECRSLAVEQEAQKIIRAFRASGRRVETPQRERDDTQYDHDRERIEGWSV